MMWKLLTKHIRKDIFYFLKSRGLIPEEQKWCPWGTAECGPMLVTVPSVVRLLVPVLVLAVLFVTTTFSSYGVARGVVGGARV